MKSKKSGRWNEFCAGTPKNINESGFAIFYKDEAELAQILKEAEGHELTYVPELEEKYTVT